ncbi:MAG: SAM-dependent DNA methyltransferase [Erysipelotrichaceae bacterium]|nr:SAM-dependent DNA methyltransferase [Erysipelotrichaceae bacterium]
MDIRQKTIALIDSLKQTCQTYGISNDGNEYKIITQVFLYKFLNDKFGFEVKKLSSKLQNAEKWELAYKNMSEDERLSIFDKLSPDIPRLNPEHLIANLWNQQSKGDFDLIFDSAMLDIAEKNIDIFSTQTAQNTRIPLFEKLTNFIDDDSDRAPFARALVDKLANFSFEEAFDEHYDFFAGIFEYVIKDYNNAGGSKYAEYYTPHFIATIMARLLVGDSKNLHNIEIYDPSAGTGTLLMALAHQIGEDKCTIFSQDISQKSNKMLKLNLILNGLVSSLDHAIQGDTLVSPYHKSDDKTKLRQFDYIVSNPPFKLDFVDTHASISAQTVRFWAGVPNIPKKIEPKKPKMAIYTCFIQHVVNSLKPGIGKGAIVVPTGFLTASSGVEGKIISKLIEDKLVYGVISMPSNVFANTGTNVSVLFLDASKTAEEVILIDASNLGEDYQDNGNKKRRLKKEEIDLIVNTFVNKDSIEDFSILVSHDKLNKKKMLAAGQYFNIRVKHEYIDPENFKKSIEESLKGLSEINSLSDGLNETINANLEELIKWKK